MRFDVTRNHSFIIFQLSLPISHSPSFCLFCISLYLYLYTSSYFTCPVFTVSFSILSFQLVPIIPVLFPSIFRHGLLYSLFHPFVIKIFQIFYPHWFRHSLRLTSPTQTLSPIRRSCGGTNGANQCTTDQTCEEAISKGAVMIDSWPISLNINVGRILCSRSRFYLRTLPGSDEKRTNEWQNKRSDVAAF